MVKNVYKNADSKEKVKKYDFFAKILYLKVDCFNKKEYLYKSIGFNLKGESKWLKY